MSRTRKVVEVDVEEVRLIQAVPLGSFVKKLRKDGTPQRKVWVLYYRDAAGTKYGLYNYNDVNESVYIKRGTEVLVGFTY